MAERARWSDQPPWRPVSPDDPARRGWSAPCAGRPPVSAVDALYARLAKPILFRLRHGDPEAAHHATLAALSAAGRFRPALSALSLILARNQEPRTVFGVRFPSA